MQSVYLKESDFSSGRWLAKLQELLNLNRVQRRVTNGAEQIGRFILDRVLKDFEV
jgi:hypothetical protein